MSENQDLKNQSKTCFICKDMYGHQTFKGMCSKCFKMECSKDEHNLQLKKNQSSITNQTLNEKSSSFCQQNIQVKQVKAIKHLEQHKHKQILNEKIDEKLEDKQPKVLKQKCRICLKKLGILNFSCRHCIGLFCKFHRLPEEHNCQADFFEIGKLKLRKQNPIVSKQKIEKI